MARNLMLCLAAVLAGALVLPAGPALAHEFMLGNLTIIHPTARPNLPNRPMAAYVALANDGDAPDRLVAVSAPGFEAAELHESEMQGTMMTMQRMEAIDLPSHDTVVLEPGRLHIMLFGAAHLYKPGESFPMVLSFEKAGEIEVTVLVEKAGAGQTDHGQTDHGGTTHGQLGQSGN